MKLEVDYCKHTTICYNLTPQERSVNVLCADRNCPEWKALYTEARSWCFHHIIQVHTRNVDPNQVIIHEVYCQLYQDREVGASLFPRLWFTHYRGYQPSIMSFNREQVGEKGDWSGYMVTVSSIGDNQHCEVEVAARFFYVEKNIQMQFF